MTALINHRMLDHLETQGFNYGKMDRGLLRKATYRGIHIVATIVQLERRNDARHAVAAGLTGGDAFRH